MAGVFRFSAAAVAMTLAGGMAAAEGTSLVARTNALDMKFQGSATMYLQTRGDGSPGVYSLPPGATTPVLLRSPGDVGAVRGYPTSLGAVVIHYQYQPLRVVVERFAYTGGEPVVLYDRFGAAVSPLTPAFSADKRTMVQVSEEITGSTALVILHRVSIAGAPAAEIARFTEAVSPDTLGYYFSGPVIQNGYVWYTRHRDLYRVPVDGSAAAAKVYSEPAHPGASSEVGLTLAAAGTSWLELFSGDPNDSRNDYARLYRPADASIISVPDSYSYKLSPNGSLLVSLSREPLAGQPQERSLVLTDLTTRQESTLGSVPVASFNSFDWVFWDQRVAVVSTTQGYLGLRFEGGTPMTLLSSATTFNALRYNESRLLYGKPDNTWWAVSPRSGATSAMGETIKLASEGTFHVCQLDSASGTWFTPGLGWLATAPSADGGQLLPTTVSQDGRRVFYQDAGSTVLHVADVARVPYVQSIGSQITDKPFAANSFADANEDSVIDCADAALAAKWGPEGE